MPNTQVIYIYKALRVSMKRESCWSSCLTDLEYSNHCYAADVACLTFVLQRSVVWVPSDRVRSKRRPPGHTSNMVKSWLHYSKNLYMVLLFNIWPSKANLLQLYKSPVFFTLLTAFSWSCTGYTTHSLWACTTSWWLVNCQQHCLPIFKCKRDTLAIVYNP